jgi:hypothetical protein
MEQTPKEIGLIYRYLLQEYAESEEDPEEQEMVAFGAGELMCDDFDPTEGCGRAAQGAGRKRKDSDDEDQHGYEEGPKEVKPTATNETKDKTIKEGTNASRNKKEKGMKDDT